jgi:hypothetical protein
MKGIGSLVLVIVCLFSVINAQSCRTTTALNARSCAGLKCSVVTTLGQGTTVTISGASRSVDGYTWVPIGNNRWVANTYLSCGGGSTPSAPRPPASPPPAGNAGPLSSFPSSYSANGYTYVGNAARVLHSLKARFGATATTYASHSDGATASADLWTPGAVWSKNNGGMASMNSLADYLAANLRPLGLKYVIWKQRINTGSGWRGMENRGSITQNHFDHVHITFQNPRAAAVADGDSEVVEAFAVDGDSEAISSTSPSALSSTLPTWAIGVIAASSAVAFFVIVAIVILIIRAKKTSSEYA